MKYTKGHQNKKEKEKGKNPQNPKTGGNSNTPTGTNPQNPENITSQQGPSCLALARTKTPSIIINRAL